MYVGNFHVSWTTLSFRGSDASLPRPVARAIRRSKFLVWLRFWGYLHRALVLNYGPLSEWPVKTAHLQESNEEEVL
jgi:hypothetical protein